jgi:hypothetical protein
MVHFLCNLACSFCLRVGFRVGVDGGGMDEQCWLAEEVTAMGSVGVVSCGSDCGEGGMFSRCD